MKGSIAVEQGRIAKKSTGNAHGEAVFLKTGLEQMSAGTLMTADSLINSLHCSC